ncbi:GNAT family N-acetyltransferase [Dactylosporangium sp. NPDC051485]|uniref:GNAT family N-acetyltransferase n=1 Tax=Dactylosporangium sp. NPDC051485 TaxID=3154846 RepID=UPI003438F559
MTTEIRASAESFILLGRRVDHPDAVQLLRAFYQEQVTRYGVADQVDLDPHAFAPPHGTFLVGYRQEQPIACGGFRWHDRNTGIIEIKKTYLATDVRGLGYGRVLLSRLEALAIAWGARRAILETGVRNTAALALFTSSGYQPIACYVAGRDPAINRAFSKPLDQLAPLASAAVSPPPSDDRCL